MFGSNILDIAIGLVFLFLLLSLICSAANKLIEGMLKKRAKDLEKGITELLGDDSTKSFVSKIYDHGLVNALFSHDADANDPCVPLLSWWALETHLAEDRATVIALFQSPALWNRPLVQEHILPRLMRRFAVEGRRQDLLVCAQLLHLAPSTNHAGVTAPENTCHRH